MKRLPLFSIILVCTALFLATFSQTGTTFAQSSGTSQVTPEDAKQILLSYAQRMNWPQIQTIEQCPPVMDQWVNTGFEGACATRLDDADMHWLKVIKRYKAIQPDGSPINSWWDPHCKFEMTIMLEDFYYNPGLNSELPGTLTEYRGVQVYLNNGDATNAASAKMWYKSIKAQVFDLQEGKTCAYGSMDPTLYQPLIDLMLEISPPSNEPTVPEQPEPTEAPVVPSGPYSLKGTVTDGHGNQLVYVPVEIYIGEQSLQTLTDEMGNYTFPDLPVNQANFNPLENSLLAKVCLSFYDPYYNPVPGTRYPYFSVRYGSDSGSIVCALTQPFYLSETPGELTYDINLGDRSSLQEDWLAKIDPKLPANLSDVATIYFHTTQAVALAHLLKQDLDLPMDAVTFVKGGGDGACWHGQRSFGNRPWNSCMGLNAPFPFIGFGENASKYQDWGRPDNREWHEVGHHFTADGFGNFMPDYAGRKNHAGFCTNNSSNDAWTEGLAEFYAMMVGREIVGDPLFPVYNSGGSSKTYFELNYQTWNSEEFAVAGILLDLVDSDQDYNISRVSTGLRLTPHTDDDKISISPTDLWQLIVTGKSNNSDSSLGYLFDVDDLYRTLVNNQIGQDDLDKNGFTDLDDIFISHGYFSDPNGNRQYDAGEAIGLSSHPAYTVAKVNSQGQPYTINCQAMPTREDALDIPGGYIQVSATDQGGSAVPVDIYTIDIEFDAPYEYYAYSYDVPADALQNGRLYLTLPPESYPSRATITAGGTNIINSDAYTIDNATYWRNVPDPNETPLSAFNFTVTPKTQASSFIQSWFLLGAIPGALCFGVSFIALIAGVFTRNKKLQILGLILIVIVTCLTAAAAIFYGGSRFVKIDMPNSDDPAYLEEPTQMAYPVAPPTTSFMPTNLPPTLAPSVPTLVPTEMPHSQEVSAQPTVYNFAVCLEPCLGNLSNRRASFPEKIEKIYLRFNYDWIPPGSDYARVWKNQGQEWVRYQCQWDGPESGVFETNIREPAGFRSGDWTMEIYVDGQLIAHETVNIQGSWDYWDPAETIDRCK